MSKFVTQAFSNYVSYFGTIPCVAPWQLNPPLFKKKIKNKQEVVFFPISSLYRELYTPRGPFFLILQGALRGALSLRVRPYLHRINSGFSYSNI